MIDRRSPHLFHPLFDRRAGRPVVLPLLAAVLALMLYVRDARADAWGAMNKGVTAFVVVRNPPCVPACWPPLVREFTIKLDLPNVPNQRGWR